MHPSMDKQRPLILNKQSGHAALLALFITIVSVFILFFYGLAFSAAGLEAQPDEAAVLSTSGASPAAQAADPVLWIWSGAVTTHSAKVNARLNSASDNVRLALSQNSDLSRPTFYGPLAANARNSNTVSFALGNLNPDTIYLLRCRNRWAARHVENRAVPHLRQWSFFV